MIRAAIIQARCGSTRFPAKIFADLAGKPLIWHVVNRLTYCSRIDRIIIATTANSGDDRLEEWAAQQGLLVYRGDENNVLNRYYMAAKAAGLKSEDIIIRITADDPFKEPALIDQIIETVETGEAVFAYNNNPPTFPEGFDCEVFTMAALEKSEKESNDAYEREHVTQYMYRHPELFKGKNIAQKEDLSYLRFTLDTQEDYKMAQEVYRHLYKENAIFTLKDMLNLFKKYPHIPAINNNVSRSAMYTKK
jgi:spore coat polysaccharide biosynthesis protein SpsF